ncbi:MAG: MBL fold metallo-hydrolase [Hyphomonas sp.]
MLNKTLIVSLAVLLGACQSDAIESVTGERQNEKPATEKTSEYQNQFVTLGTKGGPLLADDRSQPANALIDGEHIYLVDVGDGAAGQFAKLGLPLKSVDAVFLSHLHFDHTAGLMGVLGLRYQTSAQKPITIYGPPGTRETVDGLFAAMVPEMRVGYAVPGAKPPPSPQEKTIVVELVPDSTIDVNGMKVTTVENTHYTLPAGSEAAKVNKSYAYRFDLSDRSIVFTGDTGPSESVERLAQGADLLVSEMMDVPFIIENMKRTYANNPKAPPPQVLEGVFKHLRDHHVTAEQVGEMASRSGVKQVVVTHFAAKEDAASLARYEAEIAKNFDGDIAIAKDLQRF